MARIHPTIVVRTVLGIAALMGVQRAYAEPAALGLKDLAERRGLNLGSYYQASFRGDPTYEQVLAREFKVLTAGTFMGDGSCPSRTEFDFTELDYIVNWGLAHGMELHAHTLVWYSPTELPDWLKAMPRTKVEAVMNERIDRLVGRYRGKIKLWNVVNEAVNDGADTLRTGHVWYDAMGHDYIRKAFLRAHKADPSAILTLNEFDIEHSWQEEKYRGVKRLLKDLLRNRVPVHALEWQVHLRTSDPPFEPDVLLARMQEIADLGLDNYISELDVELPKDASAADHEAQKRIYQSVVSTFLQARRRRDLVIWGVRDGDPNWLPEEQPLLFDENLAKKPAYHGVVEALRAR
jgi:endo-1,4-beta-xylanase